MKLLSGTIDHAAATAAIRTNLFEGWKVTVTGASAANSAKANSANDPPRKRVIGLAYCNGCHGQCFLGFLHLGGFCDASDKLTELAYKRISYFSVCHCRPARAGFIGC